MIIILFIIMATIIRKGLIYFPDFCQIVLERFRENEAEEEEFRKTIFKVVIMIMMMVIVVDR